MPFEISSAVRDAIAKKYGYGEDLDDNAIREAQELAQADRSAAGYGSALSTLTSAISGGNKPDNSFYDKMRSQANQPVVDVETRRKGLSDDQKFGDEQALRDPESPQSRSFKEMLINLDPVKFTPESLKDISAKNIDLVIEPWKVEESINTRKALLGLRANAANERTTTRKENAAKITDKQADEISEFDKSIAAVEAALNASKDSYVGPVAGLVPELLVGGEEAAFRASVGRMSDAYRKLITGAGASNQELARLESRLPKVTDKPETFKSKAQEFIREVQRNRGTFLETQRRRGKDVAPFQTSAAPKPSLPAGDSFSDPDKEKRYQEWKAQQGTK